MRCLNCGREVCPNIIGDWCCPACGFGMEYWEHNSLGRGVMVQYSRVKRKKEYLRNICPVGCLIVMNGAEA